MGIKCFVKSCNNTPIQKKNGLIKDLMFHRFPTNAIRRERWIANIQVFANQIGTVLGRAAICSEHFDKTSYIFNPDGSRSLSKTAEPTKFAVPLQRHGADASEFKDDSFTDVEK
ncbi:hypothetical protein Bhyg_12524 [Pseudolycoriella hygida]|uniref:THAP-type domain-containing protein n=1 Tax=Pseudolycoriella hygida TaxID=35572 RepID=A0A9Q0MZR0_9DIPT|nr:hypothetical protein Bhyg_17565 [Pseudolycoriella hygida]KAJ6639777.1 hypothetical protein Bhyg_12524 [Pseudolycoriella hygida]